MKTERRHELQHNMLADTLENAAESLKPYTQLILGVALAIAVVYGVYKYWTNRSQADLATSWNSYLQATATDNVEELRSVGQDFPGTPAATWANLTLGDRSLAQGLDQLFTNRADAKDELKKAEDFYLAVRESAHEPLLEQRATLGLARVYESNVQLDKAREEYERLKQRWPGSVYVDIATQRLADLGKKSTLEFYDWFAANEPKPAVSGLGTPGLRPPFEAPLDPDHGSFLNQNKGTPPGETSKPDDVDIKLTPPLLGTQKDKPTLPADTTPNPEKTAPEPEKEPTP